MIADVHSHILPGIDDGSASVEESAALLARLREQNVRWVAATPHFYPSQDHPERFLARRAEAAERLESYLGEKANTLPIILGAEVHYYPGMSESEALQTLTLGDSHYILVEMPHSPWSERMFRELEMIRERQGLTPVIAHVDRYIQPLRDHGIPGRLESLPVLVQANASFFLRRSTRGMALRMLEKGRIHLLGSDCHNMTSRPPRLEEAEEVIRRRDPALLNRLESYENRIYPTE